MWKLFKRTKKQEQKPIYNMAQLPPNYTIERNGLGEYRWVEYYKKKPLFNSEQLLEGTFTTLSDAVESACDRYERRVKLDKSCDWRPVVGDTIISNNESFG